MAVPKIANAKSLLAVKGFRINPVIFKNEGGDVMRCGIHPALPLGLELLIHGKTCAIEGIPTRLAARAVYTLTAENAEGKCVATIEVTVSEAFVREQRGEIIKRNEARRDLDTPRSQIENTVGDHVSMNTIRPHEKFMQQPMGDDKRLSQQTSNNPDAEMRAQSTPELTPSPSAQLQQQAVLRANPTAAPTPTR